MGHRVYVIRNTTKKLETQLQIRELKDPVIISGMKVLKFNKKYFKSKTFKCLQTFFIKSKCAVIIKPASFTKKIICV